MTEPVHPPLARLLPALLLLVAVLALSGARAEEGSAVFAVRYRSADTVYVEGGRAVGLSVGDRLEIIRDGEVIARIEVVFVSEHSASCKILTEQQPIRTGDRARFDGDLSPPPPAAEGESTESSRDATLGASAATAAPGLRRHRPKTRVSGSFTVDWENFTDQSGRGWDYDRRSSRLSLRVRDIGGQPLKFVLRLRTLEWDRAGDIGSNDPLQEERNRLYEVSLTYDPPQGRFSFSAGRLGTSPFVGIGYLDGILGQARVGGGFDVGAFYGAQPVIEEFGIDNRGAKYGAYTRYRTNRGTAPHGLELYLAGIREDGEQAVSREYAALEIRYRSGRRWSFSEHGEIDFNQDWRKELARSSVQLSNLALVGSGQLSSSTRLTVSYDRNQRYRTEETRFIPEDLFDLLWRQGLRARLQIGRPGRLQFSVDGGARERQNDPEKTYTVGAGLYHSNVLVRGLYVGGTVSLFSNPQTDGFMGNVRVAKTFRGGHELSLVLGALAQQYDELNQDLFSAWTRVGLWVELPARLFVRTELEYDNGDDLEGSRVNLGVGYRF